MTSDKGRKLRERLEAGEQMSWDDLKEILAEMALAEIHKRDMLLVLKDKAMKILSRMQKHDE